MSKKLYFMRDKDIEIVNDNVKDIIEKAHKKEITLIEPLIDEFIKVKTIILNYIKRNKRIIYGGYAWNKLIKNKSPNESFYTDTDYTDVEFYSNKPIEDMKKICDEIYDKGFYPVQGKSAQHEETYTIFVNFQGYCDITYMPTNIINNVMTEIIDEFKLIHPKFIMVDILRQFNDPIVSYWRLDKAIKRGKLMIKNYPLELYVKQVKIKQLNNSLLKLMHFIITNITKYHNIIFIGQIAYNAYIKPNIDPLKQTSEYDMTPIEIISTKLVSDIVNINNLIIKYYLDNNDSNTYNDKILIEQFYQFFQFTDKSIIFKYDGHVFLTVYGNNEKCIPYNNISLISNKETFDIKIGTFNFLFMFSLIKFHYSYAIFDKDGKILYDYIMYQLLTSRDNYFNKHNKTVLDNTIFEDFKVQCLGYPVSPIRKFLLSRRDRKLMPKSAIQPYDPEEKRHNYQMDNYHFNNYSGNIINNPKDYLLKKKI
jgi:hypothetical protein